MLWDSSELLNKKVEVHIPKFTHKININVIPELIHESVITVDEHGIGSNININTDKQKLTEPMTSINMDEQESIKLINLTKSIFCLLY